MDQNYVHVDVRNEMKKKKNNTLLEQFQNPMRNKYRNKDNIDISKSNTNTQFPGLAKCDRVKLVNALKIIHKTNIFCPEHCNNINIWIIRK